MTRTQAHEPSPATANPADAAPIALSIVVPAYNEQHRLGRTIDAIRQYAQRFAASCELIVVDDGSTDGTAELVRRFHPPPLEVRLLVNERNQGKGYSVRRGVLEARGAAVLMSDADQSTPIDQADKLLKLLEQGYEVVIASRDLPESRLEPRQPWHRWLMAMVFRTYRRMLMLPDLRDTQCGFKLFDGRAARAIFGAATEAGWAFDCEVLGLARQMGYRIKEVGVIWRNDRDSRVRPLRDGLKMAAHVWRIARRLRRKPMPAEAPTPAAETAKAE